MPSPQNPLIPTNPFIINTGINTNPFIQPSNPNLIQQPGSGTIFQPTFPQQFQPPNGPVFVQSGQNFRGDVGHFLSKVSTTKVVIIAIAITVYIMLLSFVTAMQHLLAYRYA